MNREELRQKLRNKINKSRNERKSKRGKDENIIKTEMNDSRITEIMINSYNELRSNFPNLNIKTPSQLLDNLEETTNEFKLYIMEMLKLGKTNNIEPDQLKNSLDNLYTRYIISVCGIQIVPEKLQFLFSNNNI